MDACAGDGGRRGDRGSVGGAIGISSWEPPLAEAGAPSIRASILKAMTDVLPHRAIEWVLRAVPGATGVRVLGRFPGATTSTLHDIEVERGTAPALALVLRRYTEGRVLAEEPQYPSTEAAALAALASARGVVAPRLLAFDGQGDECDVPAVLMTRLPGHPTISPVDVEAWVTGLARALASVHLLDGDVLPGTYERWHDPRTAQAPAWATSPQSWERLIEASRSLEPAGETTLLHRDYHPGNVLWSDGAVSGIVDWPNACRGVPALDVGHCRRDIVSTHGVDVAEAFLAAYGEASGRQPDPLCDALTLLDSASDGEAIVRAYHAYGRTDLTADGIRARLDQYAALIASRL